MQEGHIPLCVLVRGANHLREVDDDGVARLAADQDIELVEVAMDEPYAGKTDDHIHQL